MSIVCPTVTATDALAYREQIELATSLSKRIHVDLSDGQMARPLIDPIQMWWPDGVEVDLRMMAKEPATYIDTVLNLRPEMVITHSSAKLDFLDWARQMHEVGIKVGVALDTDTRANALEDIIAEIDHVLVFSGNLGHFGGEANLYLLEKVRDLKVLKADLEIGWDGGINDENAEVLIKGGVGVLNVGGFIQRSDNPQAAYAKLIEIAK